MYSLVLMSAMSASPGTAGFNGLFRDWFDGGSNCNGCCGGAVRYNCTGASNSCCGGGCCGGSFLGIRDWWRSWWNANGCCGGGCCGGFAYSAGCCGGIAYGCSGSAAYPYYGGPAVSYTPVFNGGLSCFGGPAMPAPAPVFDAPPPVYQGAPLIPSSPAIPAAPTIPPPATVPPPGVPYAVPEAAPGATNPMIVPERSGAGLRPAGFSGPPTATVGGSAGTRATVLVRLPADARLFADGTPLRMTGGERKFVTPALPAGMEYTYQLTAQYERNGEVVSVSKKVAVQGGGSVAIEFADLTAAKGAAPSGADVPPAKLAEPVAAMVSLPKTNPGVNTPGSPAPAAPITTPAMLTPAPTAPAAQSAPATITVKLPPGATLLVDGQKSPSSAPVRRFSTPPLPAGKEFAYLLRVEVVRNGHPESLTEKVVFRAGEQLDVDFTTFTPGR